MNVVSSVGRLGMALLLAVGCASAVFAFSERAAAKEVQCCLIVVHCMGDGCTESEECGTNGFCCSYCGW